MRTLFHRNGLRSPRLARAIVMLFLIYTGLDLIAPQLCNGEESAVCQASRIVGLQIDEPDVSVGPKSSDTNRNEEPENQHDEDDCFCCCAHALPARVIASLEASDVASLTASAAKLTVPSPSLPPAFHPPRFA